MQFLFLPSHCILAQWGGLMLGLFAGAWVCLRLGAQAASSNSSSPAPWAGLMAIIAPLLYALTLARLQAITQELGGVSGAQLKWTLYVGVTFCGWVGNMNITRKHLTSAKSRSEQCAWAALASGVWVMGGLATDIWALFLILELSLIFLLLNIAHTQLVTPPPTLSTNFRSLQQSTAEQGFLWACLLILWASAFTLLGLIWAWAALYTSAPFITSLSTLSHLEWGLAGGSTGINFQWCVGSALLLKTLLTPAQFVLVQFYSRLTPTALVMYLCSYYIYFLPLAAINLFALLPALLPGWVVLSGLSLGLAGLCLLAELRPLRDFKALIAFSTLFTLLLLLLAGFAGIVV